MSLLFVGSLLCCSYFVAPGVITQQNIISARFEKSIFDDLLFVFQRDNSSTLIYVPNIGDHRKVLTCKAENPDLQNSAIQDSLTLQVHCKSPRLKV